MKKDKYLRARGGTSQMIDLSCSSCGRLIFHYQKDGIGTLRRCYINRITGPDKWSGFQTRPEIKTPSDLPNLVCECGEIIGCPMLYKDGRLAFRLERGKFERQRSQAT